MPALANPTVSFGTTTATSQVVNWTTVPNATSYTVKRNTTNTQTGAATIYTGALLTFSDSGLTASTAYYYFVIPIAAGYTAGLGTGTVTTSAAPVGEAVVFAENFANTSTVGAALSTVNWRVIEGDGYSAAELPQTATSINSNAGSGITAPVAAGYSTTTNLGYLVYANGKLAQMIYTEKYLLPRTTKTPTKVRFVLSASVIGATTTVPSAYVLAKVGTSYYVYDAPQVAAAASGNVNTFDGPVAFSVALDMTTAGKWRALNYAAGANLYVGAPLAGTLPAGDANFGVFFTSEGIDAGNNGTNAPAVFGSRVIKLDSFELLAQ